MARKATQTKPEPSKSAVADKPETVEQPKDAGGAAEAVSTPTGEATSAPATDPSKTAAADKAETTEQPKDTEGAEDARSNAAEAPSTPAAEQGHQAAGGDDEPPAAEAAMIVVTGPERGRRRIGRKFGGAPVLIPVDELTEAEIAALASDPMLRVVLLPAPDA